MSSTISFLSFKNEVKSLFLPSNKVLPWGEDNLQPFQYLDLYYKVPEHTSSIDFITNTVVGEGVNTDKIDYWLIKKLTNDFNLFGGFAIQVIKTRNGGATLSYLDVTKCRYSVDKKHIGYAEEGWDKYKQEYTWYKITDSLDAEGIFLYKNNNSRGLYPTPYYYSSVTSLNTMSYVSEYHNNNASNGFSPSVVINFNNGVPDDATQKKIEKGIEQKFTGEKGQKFILSFNDSPDTKTTIEPLQNDNLDQKFADLQKFLQGQIIIGHKITSGTLIGVKPENTGFSKQEFDESLEVFREIVINGIRKEIEYALSLLTKTKVEFLDANSIVENNTINKEGGVNVQ